MDQPGDKKKLTSEAIEEALQEIWGIANDLSRVAPPNDRYRVSIFGSSRACPGDALYEEVKELARRLALSGCDIMTGGGPGLMQAANEGAQLGDPEHSRESVGLRIDLPFEQSTNPFVERVYHHRTFFTRLHQFMRMSSAFIAVTGGIGTTLELMLVWQLLQVKQKTGVPLVLVGEMWKDLEAWAEKHMTQGELQLASAEDVAIPQCVDTTEEAAAIIEAHYRDWAAKK